MVTILYKTQDRPYSQNELKDQRDILYKKLRLSKIVARHEECGHFYLVKTNGKKYKQIVENNYEYIENNCSVCWKCSKTYKKDKNNVYDLIENYMIEFSKDYNNLTFRLNNLEEAFYTWLYSK